MNLVGGAILISGGMDIEMEGAGAKGFDEVPEAQPYLGLAVELAPDNQTYQAGLRQLHGLLAPDMTQTPLAAPLSPWPVRCWRACRARAR